MGNGVQRYSRILVLIPPDPKVKREVNKLVKDTFSIIPEYIENQDFEGYAISWRTWYGFEGYKKGTRYFPTRLKMIIDNWLGPEEDVQIIEYIDEDSWKWLDVRKDWKEIFQGTYKIEGGFISVSSSYLFINEGNKSLSFWLDQVDSSVIKKHKRVLRKLAQRGYWNTRIMRSEEIDNLYERIGFNFGELY